MCIASRFVSHLLPLHTLAPRYYATTRHTRSQKRMVLALIRSQRLSLR
jgi:hypothetical protein